MIRDWSNFIAGRTALVTGSGGGVGRAIAIQMARAGAKMWINDLHRDRAEKVCREIEEEQRRGEPGHRRRLRSGRRSRAWWRRPVRSTSS